MSKIPIQMKSASRPLLMFVIMALALGTLYPAFCGARYSTTKAWSFGVMSDTQWSPAGDPAGTNANTISASILTQMQAEFIKRNVKFVVQLGDSANWPTPTTLANTSTLAANLYSRGIGYFPMRGNHETYMTAFFNSPTDFNVAAFKSNFPQTQGLSNTFGATSFSSPTSVSSDLTGLSYAFNYGSSGSNARFVVLDVMQTTGAPVMGEGFIYFGYPIGTQQSWISTQLDKNTRGTTHAFVFSHQPLMGENHMDTPFGGFASPARAADQNTFYASMQDNNVKYFIAGHDHMFQHSLLASPDGASKVKEIISGSASSKYYPVSTIPAPSGADPSAPGYIADQWYGRKSSETPLMQELNNIGFFVYTVDGPRVTIDYYANDDNHFKSDASYPNNTITAFTTAVTPKLNFALKDSFGYSLNGKEFLVAQNGSYTAVSDTYSGTTARILSGVNLSTAVDANARKFTKAVNTGWSDAQCYNCAKLVSSILTLWGMADFGTNNETETYTLSMTYSGYLTAGLGGIATLDSQGNWVNAVDMNFGGTKKFVNGPWLPGYGLGTYGFDSSSKTAWAVIDYNADFAVASGFAK